VEEIVITNFEGVYEPAEDSWLIARHIPKLQGNVLEIGSGTGIISIHLAKKGYQVTAIDLNPKAVEATKFNARNNNVNIEVLEGNMFDPVKSRKFDLIVSNPPYLPPTDEYNDPELALAVEGGPTGSEFTISLLTQAKKYLNPNGSIYMILSSRMKEFEVDWKRTIIRQEKYFFERLNLVHFF
jgi:release factor glutamine methyltransferase|tara:strand:+ start:45 stop:593 length:549 start_codon:yes stop_codon:yes gene_type:complete